jgi:hypothetical protein
MNAGVGAVVSYSMRNEEIEWGTRFSGSYRKSNIAHAPHFASTQQMESQSD